MAIANRLKKAAGFRMIHAGRVRVVLGLTGGTGAGKTSALRAIESLNGLVVDCDAVYHEMLRSDAPMLEELKARFPHAFEHGVVDRKKLGQEVFQNEDRLEQLNDIVYRHLVPKVRRDLAASDAELCAIDAINLVESGLGDLCDRTVAVTSPTELRVRRIMARDQIGEQYARLRIAAQKSDEYYRGKCDLELDNRASSAAEFEAQAKEFFAQLIETIKEEKTHGQSGI